MLFLMPKYPCLHRASGKSVTLPLALEKVTVNKTVNKKLTLLTVNDIVLIGISLCNSLYYIHLDNF
jgi:hypothetical protein